MLISLEGLSNIVIIQGICIIFLGIVILSARRRSKRAEELLKIALGEVEVTINMGDYIRKNKKQILKNANNTNLNS